MELSQEHKKLIDAAAEVLELNAQPVKHSVGAAVLCGSGRIFTGVNIESSGYGICAEGVALGSALSSGEREIMAVVAVVDRGTGIQILSPCGNCRQMALDYAPDAEVIYAGPDGITTALAREMLPGAYRSPDFQSL